MVNKEGKKVVEVLEQSFKGVKNTVFKKLRK